MAARAAGGPPAALRPGSAGFAEAGARLGLMPLDRFAREGQLLEVRCRGTTRRCGSSPTKRDAEAPGREGVSRGRV